MVTGSRKLCGPQDEIYWHKKGTKLYSKDKHLLFVASFGPVIVTQCLPCWLASSLPSSAFLPERDAHLLATFPGHPHHHHHPTFQVFISYAKWQNRWMCFIHDFPFLSVSSSFRLSGGKRFFFALPSVCSKTSANLKKSQFGSVWFCVLTKAPFLRRNYSRKRQVSRPGGTFYLFNQYLIER